MLDAVRSTRSFLFIIVLCVVFSALALAITFTGANAAGFLETSHSEVSTSPDNLVELAVKDSSTEPAAVFATITVNSTLHGTDANPATTTLVEAIQQANTLGGSNTIVLPATTSFFSDDTVFIDGTSLGRTMYPAITSNITIQGNGSTLDATGKNARFFFITGSNSLTLDQINLVGGKALGGDGASGNFGGGGGGAGMGGAIFVNGASASLIMRRSSIFSSVAQGGAAINATNFSGPGGGGGGMGGNGANSGGGGPRSSASGNTGGDGVGGNGGANNGGPGGGGGGGINPSGAGSGGFGGGGGGGWSNLPNSGTSAPGGFGGGGGGSTSSSASPGGTFGGNGAAYNNSGFAIGGGGAGLGGGIFNLQGTVTLENVTLSRNSANGGDSSPIGITGNGFTTGSGVGGGIFNYDGAVTLKHVTISSNTVSTPFGAAANQATGGSVYNYDAAGGGAPSVTLFNSILANSTISGASGTEVVNTGAGTVTASGAANTNVIRTSTGTITGTVLTSDPLLSFAARFGGVTAQPPTATSPILNVGDNANSLAVDAYGNARPASGTVDIGAVEGIPSTAFTLTSGMILVSDTGADAVYAVNPANGDRSLVSKLNFVGTGPDIGNPVGIVADSSMNIYVVNTSPVVAIIKIDPLTGNRTTVSQSAGTPVGTGAAFNSPSGIAIRSTDGKLLVSDTGGTNGSAGSDAVIVVDPANGNRSILTDDVTPNTTNAFTTPANLIYHSTQGTIVTDTSLMTLYKVDGTGARTVLSSNTAPNGTNPFAFPSGIAEDTDQTILVVDQTTRQLIRVNQSTGARTVVSTLSATDTFQGVTVAPAGIFVTKSTNPDAIYKVDAGTGALTLAANNSIGNGFFFGGTATNIGFNLGIATIPGATSTATSTSVASSANPSTYGDNVTFTATVSPVPPGGTVQFVIDGSNAGSPVTVDGMGKATYMTSALTVNGGTPHTVTANYSGSGTYLSSSGSLSPSQSVSAASSLTTVTCGAGPFVYTGTAQTPCSVSVTGAGGLTLTPTPNYSNNTNAGTATASYTYAGDANHTGSMDSKNFSITKATSSVAVAPLSTQYDGTAKTTTAVVSGVGTGITQTVTWSYSGNCSAAPVNVAETPCTGRADYAGDSNHSASFGTNTITITKAPSSVAVAPLSTQYDGTAKTTTAVVSGVGTGITQIVTWSYSGNCSSAPVNVAETPCTARADYAGDTNHDPSFGTNTISITQATTTTTVAFETGPYTYRGSAFTATASVTGIGSQSFTVPVTVTYSGDCTNVTTPNGCTANASYAGDSNHTGSSDSKSITITQKPATWTTNPNSKVFGTSDPVPLTTGSGSGFLMADNVTATYSRVAGEAASPPTYHITAMLTSSPMLASVGGGLNNYSITNNGAEFTIFSRNLSGTVTLANAPSTVVPDVVMSAAGGPPSVSNTLTNASGAYTMTGFGSSSYTITPSKTPYPFNAYNGVFSNDATLISRHVVGLITLTPEQLRAAKVSGLPNLSSYEAALVAQYIVGISHPINQTGQWTFTPVSTSLIVGTSSTADFAASLMGDVNGDWTANPCLTAFTSCRPDEPLTDPERIRNAVHASLMPTKASPGSEITVPFRIDNLRGKAVDSFQFDIEYDPEIVSPAEIAASIEGTNAASMSIAYNSPQKGLLKVVVYGAYPASGDGVFVNLRFRVTGTAGTATPLTIRGFRFNDGNDDVYSADSNIAVRPTDLSVLPEK